ncbi:MAG TPA: hypothetical protein VFZ70_02400 [Euzebyales bacterium]
MTVTATHRIDLAMWPADYGSPVSDDGPATTTVPVDYDPEVTQAAWAPVTPAADAAVDRPVWFVDGVRRMEARAWITTDDGATASGLVGSWAAGAIRCDGSAVITDCRVERGLFSAVARRPTLTTDDGLVFAGCEAEAGTDAALRNALQARMRGLELDVARDVAASGELIVLDGPLRRRVRGHAVGYVKTQHVDYLAAALRPVVADLAVAERTPLFVLATDTYRHWSWYLRLATVGRHPWESIVRCEIPADGIALPEARALADTVTGLLPRFASSPHRDVRAPQNLYPIGALEQHLRHRLGDAAVIGRRLRRAVHRVPT